MADERSVSSHSNFHRSEPEDRTIDGQAQGTEKRVDHALRPRNLDEMIGQDRLRDKIKILVEAARQRDEALDHVLLYGSPGLYRQYIIAHAGHVDKHADGGWGYSSSEADPAIPDMLTPMQAYAQRTFQYLEDWVEDGLLPPDSKFVETDPTNDITDPSGLDW